MNEIYGVIWDMDGVMIDSVPFHYRAWQAVFSKRGKNLDKSISEKPFGHIDTIKSVMGKEISDTEIKAIALEKEVLFRELIRENLHPLPGVISLLKDLRNAGFKLALASSSPRQNIKLILDGLGANSYFDTVVSAEDVSRVKPDPEVFVLAAARLDLDHNRCIVIEDMPAGVNAAKSLGMLCIGVATNRPVEMLREADIVVKSLSKVTLQDLFGLFHSSRC